MFNEVRDWFISREVPSSAKSESLTQILFVWKAYPLDNCSSSSVTHRGVHDWRPLISIFLWTVHELTVWWCLLIDPLLLGFCWDLGNSLVSGYWSSSKRARHWKGKMKLLGLPRPTRLVAGSRLMKLAWKFWYMLFLLS